MPAYPNSGSDCHSFSNNLMVYEMTDFWGKSLGSFQSFLSSKTGSSRADFAASTLGSLSCQLHRENFIKAVASAESKQEEEDLIKKEIPVVESILSKPGISPKVVEQCLIQSLYCEMLGYPVTFAYVHAVKLAQQGNIQQKRIGYLAFSQFLSMEDELGLLLINTIQKDIRSTNVANICMGLQAVSYVVNAEMVPAVYFMVEEKLKHAHAAVRKYAVLALQHCLLQASSHHSIQSAFLHLEQVLSDNDISVVAAAVTTLETVLKMKNVTLCQHLIPSLIQIQQQIIQGRLSTKFEFHSVPFPWLQIKLLRLLGVLCAGDKILSESIIMILKETLQKAEINQPVAYAIIFECIVTISTIEAPPEMVELALKCVSKFLKSSSTDLKYLGVKVLAGVLNKLQDSFSTEHQDVVMECLQHPDETLHLKTLDLLYVICNPSNVHTVCAKMIDFLEKTQDTSLQRNLVSKVLQLAGKHSSDHKWIIVTLERLLRSTDNIVSSESVYEVMKRLKGGFSHKTEGQDLMLFAASTYWNMCTSSALGDMPELLIQLTAWTLAECWCELKDITASDLQEKLCQLLQLPVCSDETKLCILSSLTNVTLKCSDTSKTVPSFLTAFWKKKNSPLIKQKINELLRLIGSPDIRTKLFKLPDVENIDSTLSFLDEFVCEALERNASPYLPWRSHINHHTTLMDGVDRNVYSAFKFECDQSSSSSPVDSYCGSYSIQSDPSFHSFQSFQDSYKHKPSTKPKKIWTLEGRKKENLEKLSSSSSQESFPVEELPAESVILGAPLISSSSSKLEEDLEREKLKQTLFAGVSTAEQITEAIDKRLVAEGCSSSKMTPLSKDTHTDKMPECLKSNI
ncbi:AP-4 complex subunit epsilon-1-like isoform X2 [Tachypleus tridentatus]